MSDFDIDELGEGKEILRDMELCWKCVEYKPLESLNKDGKYASGLLRYICKTHTNKDSVKNVGLLHKYGISLEELKELLKHQNYKCPGCGKDINYKHSDKSTHVDHCHKNGLLRGLLCSNCNYILGHAKDSIEILNSIINYLNNPPAQALWPNRKKEKRRKKRKTSSGYTNIYIKYRPNNTINPYELSYNNNNLMGYYPTIEAAQLAADELAKRYLR